MSSKPRWGIVGTGRIASEFARGLQAVEAGNLVAVASRDATRAAEFARSLGTAPAVNVAAYGSYQELFRDSNVDVVYIATPHVCHHNDALAALQAGKHVLCEKPFTMNAEQAIEVIEAARARQLFCMEAMWMRCMPLVGQLREWLRGGKFGTPCTLHVEFGVPTLFDPDNRFFNPALGGGALLDRGVYAISLAVWLFGEPMQVMAHSHIGKTGVDEHTSLLVTFSNGNCLTASCSLRSQLSNRAVLDGAEGKGVLHEPFFRPTQLSFAPTPMPGSPSEHVGTPSRAKRVLRGVKDSALMQKLRARWTPTLRQLLARHEERHIMPIVGNGYGYEALEVARCLRDGKLESPLMPWDETLTVMRTLDAARRQIGLMD